VDALMVAYSFKPRFAEPILAGTKRQTIRLLGKRRHARPGDPLQLYTGMRTKHCKLIARATCATVHDVELFFGPHGATELFRIDGVPISLTAMASFARLDGFNDVDEMAAFWWQEHRSLYVGRYLEFKGIMVRWEAPNAHS
jgi:hypothetical protein